MIDDPLAPMTQRCAGLDDPQAERALSEPAVSARAPIKGTCRRCGFRGWMVAGLCGSCDMDREWSDTNRAFCDLLHRQAAS